jgi:hypothetical protein
MGETDNLINVLKNRITGCSEESAAVKIFYFPHKKQKKRGNSLG